MGDDYDEPPLPDELYDVIIVGTGITESILAGAVSRVGRRVLHVDANDYYGADFATFSLEQAAAWACDNRPPSGGSGGSGGGAPVAGAEARGDGEELVGSESQLPVSVLSVEVLAQRVNDGEAAQRAAVAAQHPAYGGARAFAVGSHEVRPLLDPEVTTPVFWGHTRRALEPSPRPLAAAALRSEPLPAAVPRGHAPVVVCATAPGHVAAARAAVGAAEEVQRAATALRRWQQCRSGEAAARRQRSPATAKCCPNNALPDSQALRVGGAAKARVARAHAAKREAAAAAAAAAAACAGAAHPALVRAVGLSRRFCIDLAPRLVMCSGAVVSALVHSGVGRYLEFKSVGSVKLCADPPSSKAKAKARPSGGGAAAAAAAAAAATTAASPPAAPPPPTGGGGGGGAAAHGSAPVTPVMWDVPCSKGDVFKNKQLGILEKRQLMKFLLFCQDRLTMDLGGGNEEAVLTKNEQDEALQPGRSLSRPQNKAKVQHDVAGFEERPFVEFLAHCKLSPALQQVVLYAVALLPGPDRWVTTTAAATAGAGAAATAAGGAGGGGGAGLAGGGEAGAAGAVRQRPVNTIEGLAAVTRYLGSLGRYGGTCFLTTLYGTSELPQSFCRLSAVYGGTYTLRTRLSALAVAEAEDGAQAKEGAEGREGGGGRGGGARPTCRGVVTAGGQFLRCGALVAARRHLPQAWAGARRQLPSERVLSRRVCVTSRSLQQSAAAEGSSSADDGTPLVVVIPPQTAGVGNAHAVQVVQLGFDVCAAPRGFFVLHLTTVRDVVAAAGEGGEGGEAGGGVLARAQRALFVAAAAGSERSSECSSTAEGGGAAGPVVWHMEFEQECHAAHGPGDDYGAASGLPSNVLLASSQGDGGGMELHSESAVAEARQLFERLCPGEDFLPKAASAVSAEREEEEQELGALAEAQAQVDAGQAEAAAALEASSVPAATAATTADA